MIRVVQGTIGIFRKNGIEPDQKILEETLKAVKDFFSTRHYMEKFKYRIYSIPQKNSIIYEIPEKIDKLSFLAFKEAFSIIVRTKIEETICKYKEMLKYDL